MRHRQLKTNLKQKIRNFGLVTFLDQLDIWNILSKFEMYTITSGYNIGSEYGVIEKKNAMQLLFTLCNRITICNQMTSSMVC